MIEAAEQADSSDQAHRRVIGALAHGRPVEVQVLCPDMGIDEPLAAAAQRHALDLEALAAAARSALAAPDRIVEIEVRARAAA